MPRWEYQPLLTTVVGSYPTGDLPPRRAVQRAVEEQIAAGVELISDGQVRADMIALFAARIPGLRQADDGTWEIEAALDLPDGPIAAADNALARRIAAGRARVKGIVTGPVTLALATRVTSSAPYVGPTDPALILRLAEILAHEVAALVAAGAEVVQVDEPALAGALGRRVSPELVENALRDLAALPACPALHVCGDIRRIADELLTLPFAVLDIEGTRVDNLAAIDPDQLEVADMRLSYGCVDTQAPAADSVEAVTERIRAALRVAPARQLWVSPDCGLRLAAPELAHVQLANMVAAARTLRLELA